jgi:hypothetical protein
LPRRRVPPARGKTTLRRASRTSQGEATMKTWATTNEGGRRRRATPFGAVLRGIRDAGIVASFAASLAAAVGQASEPAASSTPSASPAAAEKIRFHQRPPVVGDVVEQQLAVRLDLQTQIVQSGQVAHQSTHEMGREQRRRVEVLTVVDGRLHQARVTFHSARHQAPAQGDPGRLEPLPIHGKTYLVDMSGQTPSVTDAGGAIPPLQEYELVVDAAAQLGKPHPLSQFLVGRELAVGERLLLPRALAEELLGLDDEVGAIKKFELTLLRVEPSAEAEQSPRAVFAAAVETMPDEDSAMELAVKGQIVLEAATCRSLSAEFQGPVQATSIERTAAGIFQYVAAGEVQVAIQSAYGEARLTRSPSLLRR